MLVVDDDGDDDDRGNMFKNNLEEELLWGSTLTLSFAVSFGNMNSQAGFCA